MVVVGVAEPVRGDRDGTVVGTARAWRRGGDEGDADDPGQGGTGPLDVVEGQQHGAERVEQAVEQQGRGGHVAHRDGTPVDQQVADQQDHREPQGLGGVHGLGEPDEQPRRAQTRGQGAPGGVGDPPGLQVGHVVGVHGRQAVQRLQDDLAAGGGGPAFGGVERARLGQVGAQAEPVDREHDRERERQPPVQGRETRRGDQDRDDGAEHRGRQRDRLDEVLHVLGDPRRDVAAADALQHPRLDAERADQDAVAQVGGDPGAEPVGRALGQCREHGAGHHARGGEQEQRHEVGSTRADGVDEPAQQQRHGDGAGARERGQHERQYAVGRVGAQGPAEAREGLRAGRDGQDGGVGGGRGPPPGRGRGRGRGHRSTASA